MFVIDQGFVCDVCLVGAMGYIVPRFALAVVEGDAISKVDAREVVIGEMADDYGQCRPTAESIQPGGRSERIGIRP